MERASSRSASSGEITGDFFSIDADWQRLYLPYAPRFIQREYQRRFGFAK